MNFRKVKYLLIWFCQRSIPIGIGDGTEHRVKSVLKKEFSVAATVHFHATSAVIVLFEW